MSIIQIAPVTRTGMRLLISLYGLSETGKTLSALKLAAGLEPDPGKRMLLDSEGGQRGRAYYDQVTDGYLYAALTPPFTPERYIEALDAIEQHGVRVLVIDSISHAWFAEGGILDMVEVANERNDMAKWAKPKRRLTKMTRRMLSSDMHIILCSRAKQPLIEEAVDGRKKLVPGPVVPIQEKNLRFDMTIMAQMLGDGRFTIAAPAGKCPGALRQVFAAGEVMNEEMGRKLGTWVMAEGGRSPEARKLQTDATAAAEAGTAALQAFWKGLAREQRAIVADNLDNLKSIALAADDEAERLRAERAREEADRAADLEDPFAAGDQPAGDGAPVVTIEPAGRTGGLPQVLVHPLEDGGGPDWPRFGREFSEAIKAVAVDQVDALQDAHAGAFTTMWKAGERAIHAQLRGELAARKQAVAA